MPPQDANPTPSFGGFGLREVRNAVKGPDWTILCETVGTRHLLTTMVLVSGVFAYNPFLS